MAAATTELKHLTSMEQFLKLAQQQQQQLNPTMMWSWPAVSGAAEAPEADDGAGATWPPRSYTCAFCRREFRSAQALGGHMNVHRRDRARLRHAAAASAAAQAARAPPEFVVYPVLNSSAAAAGAAVFVPASAVSALANGDVVVSSCVAPSHGRGRDVSCNNGGEVEVDLELRLGWSPYYA